MNSPLLKAIRDIPNQLLISIDSGIFREKSDLKAARNALFVAHLIKLFGLMLFLREVSQIPKIDLKNKIKWLKFFCVSLLSRESLIIGDNIFELYSSWPTGATILVDELKKIFNSHPRSIMWEFTKAACNIFKAAFNAATLSEEEAQTKQIAFIFRNSTTEKVFQMWGELSKSLKK